ncbi:MAG: VOC family protein [Ilumatobacteraceae bacterium]
MSLIKSLGYIGIGAADLDAWRTFATDLLGLQAAQPADDVLHLRMDGRVYRIAVERGTDGALHFLGLEVASPGDLAELTSHLRSRGIEVTEESSELCATRHVSSMISALDPCGNRLEFFVGHDEATEPFVSPTGAQFVVDDMGLGHAVLLVDDAKRFLDFYVDTLGFRLSDILTPVPGIDAYFLHCNPRHHTIAAAAMPGMKPSLQHIMLQVESLDTVGRAYDKAQRDGVPLGMSLGKHTNDHMVSFYCHAPSGLEVEYGCHGRRIDDATWVVGHYTSGSTWGHHRSSVPS